MRPGLAAPDTGGPCPGVHTAPSSHAKRAGTWTAATNGKTLQVAGKGRGSSTTAPAEKHWQNMLPGQSQGLLRDRSGVCFCWSQQPHASRERSHAASHSATHASAETNRAVTPQPRTRQKNGFVTIGCDKVASPNRHATQQRQWRPPAHQNTAAPAPSGSSRRTEDWPAAVDEMQSLLAKAGVPRRNGAPLRPK